MIAISADPPAETAATADTLHAWYLLGSDEHLAVIRKWGVADPRGPYARPATFVVKGGDIVWRHVGQNKKDRPSVDEILRALEKK
jgi:peroxiredoxin